MDRRSFLLGAGAAAAAASLPGRSIASIAERAGPLIADAGTIPAATATYGDISARTAAYAAREMLRIMEPRLLLGSFGAQRYLPGILPASGLVQFRRPPVHFRRPPPFKP